MLKPYSALVLQIGWPLINKREDIKKISIPHIRQMINFGLPAANWEAPVKLIALTEEALTGVSKEFVTSPRDFARDVAAESVPGEETELLGELAKKHGTYILGCMKSRDDELVRDQYFNIGFLISPEGKVVLKHYKLQVVADERSTTPHDIWDVYTAKYGDGIEAFFQVADTEIGRIGISICHEGGYADVYSAYRMRGVEVMYRPDFPEPYCSGPEMNWWEIQNRARALDNNFYMICPNEGPRYGPGLQNIVTVTGGQSMIVDYRGKVMARCAYAMESYCNAKIDIEALRDHRDRAQTLGNWLPGLRTEYFRHLYDMPVWPKNARLHEDPSTSRIRSVADAEGLFKDSVRKLQSQGIFLLPSS